MTDSTLSHFSGPYIQAYKGNVRLFRNTEQIIDVHSLVSASLDPARMIASLRYQSADIYELCFATHQVYLLIMLGLLRHHNRRRILNLALGLGARVHLLLTQITVQKGKSWIKEIVCIYLNMAPSQSQCEFR